MSPLSSTVVDTLAETTLPLFEHKLHHKPFVIIYPRHRSQAALVSMFLRVYQDRLVYYSLAEDDNTLTAWLKHMLQDAALPVDFGTQTRAALTTKGVTPEDLAAAFGADLFMLRSEPFMFLLDMFDRLEMSDAVDRFFRALPAKMPSHAQLVFHARLLDLQPWNDLLHAGQAEVVGNEQALGGGIYGDEQPRGQLKCLPCREVTSTSMVVQ